MFNLAFVGQQRVEYLLAATSRILRRGITICYPVTTSWSAAHSDNKLLSKPSCQSVSVNMRAQEFSLSSLLVCVRYRLPGKYFRFKPVLVTFRFQNMLPTFFVSDMILTYLYICYYVNNFAGFDYFLFYRQIDITVIFELVLVPICLLFA